MMEGSRHCSRKQTKHTKYVVIWLELKGVLELIHFILFGPELLAEEINLADPTASKIIIVPYLQDILLFSCCQILVLLFLFQLGCLQFKLEEIKLHLFLCHFTSNSLSPL